MSGPPNSISAEGLRKVEQDSSCEFCSVNNGAMELRHHKHGRKGLGTSCAEAGRAGGLQTLRRHGREYFSIIGRLGQERFRQRYSREDRRLWGSWGGRPRRMSYSARGRARESNREEGREPARREDYSSPKTTLISALFNKSNRKDSSLHDPGAAQLCVPQCLGSSAADEKATYP